MNANTKNSDDSQVGGSTSGAQAKYEQALIRRLPVIELSELALNVRIEDWVGRNYNFPNYRYTYKLGYEDGFRAGMEHAVAWINPVDALPCDSADVLVALTSGSVVVGYYLETGFDWETGDQQDDQALVVGWVPFPAHPNEENVTSGILPDEANASEHDLAKAVVAWFDEQKQAGDCSHVVLSEPKFVSMARAMLGDQQ